MNGIAYAAQERELEQLRTEIPYEDGMVILTYDDFEKVGSRYRIKGRVRVAYQDMEMTGDEAEYDHASRQGYISGKVHFNQKTQWFSCSRIEFDVTRKTAVFYNASGYSDRQFLITSRTIYKTGPDTYRFDDGIVTACQEKNPKWSLTASRTEIDLDGAARLRNAKFRIKGVPIFYTPYAAIPMEKKVRSSGFIPFHTGNSTSKGRLIGEGYYQTLGRSADILVYGDYFSLRGLALGTVFRARPNPTTRFHLEAYGISDKLHQGGVRLMVDGETQLRNDWRAVARVNITSNFRFRQAFSDSLNTATISQERALVFLTRNHGSFSTNLAYDRQEVFFSDHPVVIRKIPSLEFASLGTPLGRTPFIFSFRAALDGVARTDNLVEMPRLIQRLDFHPRLTLRLPAIKGFSFQPTIGVRETYYGSQLSPDSASGIVNRSLQRRYADFTVEMRTPVLERHFSSPRHGDVEHRVEPFVTYRRTQGIKDLDKTIRFDEEDAIADTNEVEYGVFNRLFRDRQTSAGVRERRELLAFGLIQKYYFDPSFGGAFKPGQSNSFRPLDSTTAFYKTGIPTNLAPLSTVFRLSPQNGIQHDVRADFDVRQRRWRNLSISTLLRAGDFSVAGTYFRAQATEPGMIVGNHIQGEFAYGSDQGFSTTLAMSYNLRTSQLLNSVTRVHYFWNCCGVSLEFNQMDLAYRTESRLSFSFSLKGIGNFGSIRRDGAAGR